MARFANIVEVFVFVVFIKLDPLKYPRYPKKQGVYYRRGITTGGPFKRSIFFFVNKTPHLTKL